MNLAARCIWKPAKIFSRIWDSRFSQHLSYTSSLSIPFSFDSPEAHQRRSLLENLISWVDAREATVLLGGGEGGRHAVQDYLCSSVSKKSRQHKHDKLWLSRFLTECWNCVIVAAVKNLSGETHNTGEFHCNLLGVDTLWKHHHTWKINLNIRETDIYNQSYMHLTVCFLTTSATVVLMANCKQTVKTAPMPFSHIQNTQHNVIVTEWKVLLLARRR